VGAVFQNIEYIENAGDMGRYVRNFIVEGETGKIIDFRVLTATGFL